VLTRQSKQVALGVLHVPMLMGRYVNASWYESGIWTPELGSLVRQDASMRELEIN